MSTMLFVVALFAGIAFLFCAGAAFFGNDRDMRGLAGFGAVVLLVVALGVFFWAINTGGGDLAWKKFFSSSTHGTWLIVDNSGGKTMRHWVLEQGFVEPHEGGAGWQFYDAGGNLCYVGGDTFVLQVKSSLPSDFKKKYNIPDEQETLK